MKEHIITTAIVFSGHKNSFLIIEARLFKVITYSVALLGVALFNLALFDAVILILNYFKGALSGLRQFLVTEVL